MKRQYKLMIKWSAFIQYAFLWHAGLFITGVPLHDVYLHLKATEDIS